MKGRYKIVILLMSVLIFTGCGDILEGDKGPTGPTGIDGSSGTDGIDGMSTPPAGHICYDINQVDAPICIVKVHYINYSIETQDVVVQITGDGDVITGGLQSVTPSKDYIWSASYTCNEYASMDYAVTVNDSYVFTSNIVQ